MAKEASVNDEMMISSTSSPLHRSSVTSSTWRTHWFQMLLLLLLGVFVACCKAGACCKGASFTSNNSPNNRTLGESSIDPVPFPGSFWLLSEERWSVPYKLILNETPSEHLVKNFNCYVNSFLFPTTLASYVVELLGPKLGHYALCYLRNIVAALAIYYGSAAFFHYQCYIHPRSKLLFQNRDRPSTAIIMDQIWLAQRSMFFYVMLPVFSDYIIEEGWTQVYYTLEDIGGVMPYISWLFVYLALVEIGIYWMHRTLHTNKFLYKHVHALHHKYKTAEMLSPWASIAFHPLDGILQASPYVFWLLVVPCHYLTHVALLFFTAIWATYIHDALDIWNVDPIMGSKYHTIHHTHYMYNFGQVFIFCDAFWGTLRATTEKVDVVSSQKKSL